MSEVKATEEDCKKYYEKTKWSKYVSWEEFKNQKFTVFDKKSMTEFSRYIGENGWDEVLGTLHRMFGI